jgi:hypothetical protein
MRFTSTPFMKADIIPIVSALAEKHYRVGAGLQEFFLRPAKPRSILREQSPAYGTGYGRIRFHRF